MESNERSSKLPNVNDIEVAKLILSNLIQNYSFSEVAKRLSLLKENDSSPLGQTLHLLKSKIDFQTLCQIVSDSNKICSDVRINKLAKSKLKSFHGKKRNYYDDLVKKMNFINSSKNGIKSENSEVPQNFENFSRTSNNSKMLFVTSIAEENNEHLIGEKEGESNSEKIRNLLYKEKKSNQIFYMDVMENIEGNIKLKCHCKECLGFANYDIKTKRLTFFRYHTTSYQNHLNENNWKEELKTEIHLLKICEGIFAIEILINKYGKVTGKNIINNLKIFIRKDCLKNTNAIRNLNIKNLSVCLNDRINYLYDDKNLNDNLNFEENNNSIEFGNFNNITFPLYKEEKEKNNCLLELDKNNESNERLEMSLINSDM